MERPVMIIEGERLARFREAFASADPIRPEDSGVQCAYTGRDLTPAEVEQRRRWNRESSRRAIR